MSIEIKVPPLGESVTEATIGSWLKKEGDSVEADEILVELETDKVTMEVNAPAAGVLEKISAKEGDVVTIDQVIGAVKEGAVGQQKPAESKPAEQKAESSSNQTSEKIASPAAGRIIGENSLNSNAITGTGKDGRITKEDAMNSLSAPTETAVKQEEKVKMSRLRQKIAERLKFAQNNAAILTTFNEVDMSGIMALRAKHKDAFIDAHGVKLGFMSFFVKAAISALKELPAVNAEITEAGDEIIYKNYYDIGVAVGTPQGLVVPVVRDADKISFAGIEKEIGNLGKKARDGKLSMKDLSGGTFTISNGGVYGSLLSTPILNPPQSGILGMHKTQERPVVVDGKIEIRPMMYIALSYDHRIIDGKEAVTFLVKVKENIENPERLLFDL